MKIITTTLNPAFDLHYNMKNFKLYEENYVDSVLTFAGGKGINISRALSRNGMDNTAYIILGKDNASDFVSRLEADGLGCYVIYAEGKIRENITIHTPDMPETRISLEGFCLTEETVKQFFEKIETVVDENTILTFTGRIPRGLSKDSIIGFLNELKNKQCLLAVDCNSFSLDDLLIINPWLIKPNSKEIEALIGSKVDTIPQAMDAAVKIHQAGIENVIVSMGKDGAVATLSGINHIAEVPSIKPVSTIGAGDSMIAGFIGAYAKGFCLTECFKNAVAYGTAACLTEGTAPPEPEDVKSILKSINLHEVL